MAAKGSFVRSYFPENHFLVKQRIMTMAVASTGFPCSSWKTRRLSYVIASSAGNKPQNLNMVNGEKVNGIHMVESPTRGLDAEHCLGIDRNRNVVDDYDKPLHSCFFGRFVEERLVYRQTFSVRSYEVGLDKTATMETWMNLLQETALNHVTSSGLAGDGFGSTREMSLRKLIWVVTRINIQVQRYSRWGDIIEIDTWVDTEGKNGMRRDWIIRDHNTQEIITRATSTWVIMNRETRKLSKIPEQVKQELKPFYLNRIAIATEQNDAEKISKLSDESAERIRSGLAPRWSDMDANQHVNNVKYIGWILESVPMNVLEDYNLSSMTLEYRRECRQSNVIESLTSTKAEDSKDSNRKADIEYTHMLRMQADKSEIVRARTEWQSKINNQGR